jgi:hypothetical protein
MTCIGVDIGQVTDPTAIAILQRHDRHSLRCIWVERLPLGTPYHQIIDRVAEHKAKVGKATIAWDETGVGRPVVEQGKARIRGVQHIGITITGGANPSFNKGWHVPKRHLITNLQVLLQTGTLKIAGGIKDIDLKALVDELNEYSIEITAKAHETYGPWREGDHDDLVLALAVGAYVPVKLGLIEPRRVEIAL